ncbi:hypothetical protein [Chryseobacterium vrystaatense]|uniref:hypothetical protein n=1 Tax=Chryseobacterium vrystaatense TaxID=307480 RepID=UPI001114D7FC|nr:hypothetical protein [Chryseobacterium vrystaatense]
MHHETSGIRVSMLSFILILLQVGHLIRSVSCTTVFNDCKGGSPASAELPAHTRQKINYDKLCVFLKARRPQWIVHPHCNAHYTLCCKAGLEKENCRLAERHE